MSKRKLLVVILTVGLAAIFLYFALKGIDWVELGEVIRGANVGLMFVGAGITILSLFMRAYRWGVLLSGEKKIHPLTLFWATSAGYLGNTVLPARAGEVIRSVMLGRNTGVSVSYILATALTERVADVVALVIIGAGLIPTLSGLPEWLPDAMRIMAILGVIGLVILIMMPAFENLVLRIMKIIPLPEKWNQRITNFVLQFLQGGKAFRSPSRAISFIVLTALVWSLDAFGSTITARVLGLSLAWHQALLLLIALGFSSAIPSTPGYVGVYQFVAVTVLPVFAFTRSQALAFILVSQAVTVVIVVILGIIGLWQLGGNVKTLTTAKIPDEEVPGAG